MKGMVVCPEPLAAEAGVEAFRRGGNAADAAVAAAFAQCVVDPLMCGLGGTALGLVMDRRTGAVDFLDASVTIGSVPVPEAFRTGHRERTETVGRYVVEGEINQMGYQSIMVPGFVRGAEVLYERYGSGKVAWGDLLAPAIRLAEEGFDIYPYVARQWANTEDRPGYPGLMRKLTATSDCAAIYLRRGTIYKEGDRLIQADLGRTLRRLAQEGPGDFYTGDIGRRIAEDMAAHGGLFNGDDLRNFPVDVGEPVAGVYRGYDVVSTPPPGSGVQMIEMLQVLEHFDLVETGHNTPEYIELLARAMIATFLEQVVLKGDPPQSVATRFMRKGLSRTHARAIAERVRAKAPEAGAPARGDTGTTHLSAVDSAGTVVSMTHSIGSLAASGVVTPGLGFIYNNFLGHFHPLPGHPDSIVAGKRGGGGVPTVIMSGGRPVVVIGAPGGSRLITSILQTLINVLDFGMEMKRAVTAPRFHAEEPGLIFAEPAIPEDVVEAVRGRGFRVERSTYMSRVQAICIDPDTGEMAAGPDPRGGAGVGIADD